VSNFLGKLKDIIGGGQLDYQYYEQEMQGISSQDFPSQDSTFNSFSEAPGEMTTSPSYSSRLTPKDKSSEKTEYSSQSYTNLDNNVSNDLPNNVIGMPGVNNMVNEVVVIEPHSFDEVPQVIQTLKEQRSVVLNLNVMEPEEAQRAVDFIAGGTYAIDGHQERIGESIFLFTPRNVKVSTVSGKSYKTNNDAVLGSSSFSSSFSDSLWNDESLVNTHLAQ
jgi:cell division inhibitor SepF